MSQNMMELIDKVQHCHETVRPTNVQDFKVEECKSHVLIRMLSYFSKGKR